MKRRLRDFCEGLYLLAVCFFLLWNIAYMTEAQWTFAAREVFPALCLGLAGAALLLGRLKPGAGGWLLALPVWMLISSAYRGAQALQVQQGMIARAVLAFGVILPAGRVVRRAWLERGLRLVLGAWTLCLTAQAVIGLWAALTGHAVFSLKGTWYIGVNLGDHRLYLNAYVTTGAVKMGLSALLATLGAAMAKRRATKALYGLCALVQLACLSLTDCRTAFIAVGAGLGLMAAALLLKGGNGWRRRILALAAVPLCAVAAYAGLSTMLTALSPHVPATLDNLTLLELPARLLPGAAAEGAVQHRALQADNLFNDRQIIWRAALRLLAAEPKYLLTGTTAAFSSALTNLYIAPEDFTGRAFAHVHNIYLQTLVSWGVPGLLLLGAFLVIFLRAAWRVMVRHALPLWERLVPVPVLYVMLCEMVDCFTRLSEDSPLLLFACFFAGLTLAMDARARREAQADKPAAAPVDVIIPVYNASDYVARAAASALACPGTRVILVDDGSTDGSGSICDALAGDDRVTVIHQPNRGASAARNAGLQAAAAEFVAFLDADDVLLGGALAALTECLGAADAAQGVIVRRESVDTPRLRTSCLSGRAALAAAMSDPTRHLLCHGWVFRRSLLTERFDERLRMGEDGEWMLRTLRHADRAVFTNVPAYRYTVRADSALRSAAGVQQAYRRTLEAAQGTLAELDMPRETALLRLTHLLLMLTHGGLGEMASLRDASPFAEDFRLARLGGLSPRMMTLRLLKWRAYPLVRLAIGLRRLINRRSAERVPEKADV